MKSKEMFSLLLARWLHISYTQMGIWR